METLDETTQGSVSLKTIEYMRTAAPWLKFISVTAFVLLGISAIGSVAILFMQPLFGLLYAVIIGFGIYLNVLVFKMARQLKNYATVQSQDALEIFFKCFKILVLVYGIVLVIYIAFFVITMLVGGLKGIAAFGDML